MPGFAFRLQPVLKYRERIEDEKQGAFAQSLRNLRDAENERDVLIARHKQIADDLRSGHHKVDVDALRMGYAHLEYLAKRIREAQVAVDVRAGELLDARAALVVATKDRKVLDNLKARKRTAFEAEQASYEQRELDDSNARRFGRAAAQERQLAP